MTQPIDLISGALLDIGAREAGETAGPDDANEAFILMKQMMDSWWNESMMLFFKQEVIQELTGGQYIYTIGPGGSISGNITASITGNILTVTTLNSGSLSVGNVLTGTNITANTTIIGQGTGIPGNTSSVPGTYYLNLTYTNPVVSQTMIGYPARPLKINSATVRIVNSVTGTLDYPVAVINLERYELIGIKTLPGPWPRALYYQPTEPLGVLNYWPNPSSGEMHLFCDPVPTQFATINDTMYLPQGSELAIRSNLAVLLMPGYGKASETQINMIIQTAKFTKANLKRTNMQPLQTAQYDTILTPGRINDASFILDGGFR